MPKCENPTSMKDIEPISICNVLFKIMSKAIKNRLKKLLPNIIFEEHAAFVPSRYIIKNVLVAFESLHYMKRKSNDRKGDVAMKIDISRAYDRIYWGFLKAFLLKIGFGQHWVDLIMFVYPRFNI